MAIIKTSYPLHPTKTGYDFRVDPQLKPLQAIRKKCLECQGGMASEVRACEIYDCPLWPYRSGRVGECEITETETPRWALPRTCTGRGARICQGCGFIEPNPASAFCVKCGSQLSK